MGPKTLVADPTPRDLMGAGGGGKQNWRLKSMVDTRGIENLWRSARQRRSGGRHWSRTETSLEAREEELESQSPSSLGLRFHQDSENLPTE